MDGDIPDNKVHGANMGPTWGREDLGGPHVGHVKLAIWDGYQDDVVAWKHIPHYWSFMRGIFLDTTGFSLHKVSNAEVLYFLWCMPEPMVDQTTELWEIWDAMMLYNVTVINSRSATRTISHMISFAVVVEDIASAKTELNWFVT